MAKGGSRGRRSYTRDARGRFASTPGGGAKPKPPRTSFRQRQAVSLARSRGQTGRLGSATKAAKARLKATRARTGAGASPQQKAALTRAKRMAAALAGERRVKTAQKAGVVKGRVKRDPGVGAKLGAVRRKTIQGEQARKDRAEMAADRKREAKQLLAMPKAARRAIQTARTARRGLTVVAGRTSALLQNIEEGRMQLARNYGKRKDKLSPKAIASITESMQSSASKLRAIAAEQKTRNARPASKVGIPGSVSGLRKRSSESHAAATKRKRDRAESNLRSLYDLQQGLETSINRRRGRIEGVERETAKKNLKKVNKSIETTRAAIQSYDSPNQTPRTGKRAPADERTARNRLDTMNRRVSYLRKNELLPLDKWGRRQFTGKLKQASKDRIAALAGISGQRFTYRSKRRATIEQRVRTNRVLDLSRKRYHGGQSGDDYARYGIKTKRDTRKRKGDTIRATSRQGNLLTGGFERVRSGRFRPLAGRTWF